VQGGSDPANTAPSLGKSCLCDSRAKKSSFVGLKNQNLRKFNLNTMTRLGTLFRPVTLHSSRSRFHFAMRIAPARFSVLRIARAGRHTPQLLRTLIGTPAQDFSATPQLFS
jgi:hypothetical protein